MAALVIIVIVSSASLIGALTWFLLNQTPPAEEPSILVTGRTGSTQSVTLTALLELPEVERSSSVQASNGSFVRSGVYKGVNVSTIVELVGGMNAGNLLNISSTIGYELFTYENVYPSDSTAEIQGPLILAYSFNSHLVPTWDAGYSLVTLPPDQQYNTSDYVNTISEELIRGRTPSAELAWITNVNEIRVVGGTTLTVAGVGKSEVLNIAQLRLMPTYSGWGARIHTVAVPPVVVGPYHYIGVNLTNLLDRVGPLPDDYDVLIEASDGYTVELSKSQANGNITLWSGDPPTADGIGYVALLIAYAEVGMDELSGGPLRLVFVNTSLDESAPWTDGELWCKYVVRLEVLTDIMDWELCLKGLVDYNMTRSEFEQAASCTHHQTSYSDGSHMYSGLPLWIIIAWIDQYTAPSHPPTFNDTLSATNYTILLFDSYGQNVSWGSLQIAYNDSIILANKIDDQRLSTPNWPLLLVGADVPLSSRFGNIIRIVLVGVS